MDHRIYPYYERELRHLRTVAGEFATENPKIADRLSLGDFKCVDPYVERLLEGFAFMTARVQLKLDSEFPRFTQNLFETVFPHYLAPTPSMCIAQFNQDPGEAGLAEGLHRIPRGSVLRSVQTPGLPACEYRTAHDVTLWPLNVAEARYFTRDAGTLELNKPWNSGLGAPAGAPLAGVKAALRLRLRTTASLPFSALALDELVVHLKGGDATPMRIYEQALARAVGVVVRPVMSGNQAGPWQVNLPASAIGRLGYSAAEALLPYDARSFQGYRLLHEYFAFPQRFLFLSLKGLAAACARCNDQQLDIIIAFSQESVDLEGAVDGSNFALHCTPAVNLFPKRADRIFVTDKTSEFQVIPDRTRPLDFEVYRVNRVTGFGSRSGDEREFRPFYSATDNSDEGGAYFSVNRVPRSISEREQSSPDRSRYAGSEVYVSLVDSSNAPYSADLKQLGVETWCTNRALPVQMPLGRGKTDFTLDVGAPVESVRVVGSPTRPRPSHAEGEMSWRLISHMSLNYLTITDEDTNADGRIDPEERRGVAALRDLLRLYGDAGDPTIRKQIDAVRGVETRPITRRVPSPGAIAFARGLEVILTLEETGFEGGGVFALGAVLEQFFARYVSTNSFTETVIQTTERGEIMRWTARPGQRPIF